MNQYEAFVQRYRQLETYVPGETPIQVPFWPQKISQGLSWHLTRVSAVRGQRLTAEAMEPCTMENPDIGKGWGSRRTATLILNLGARRRGEDKGKGKGHHRTGHKGPEGGRGIALLFL